MRRLNFFAVVVMQQDIMLGEFIFVLIPGNNMMNLATVRTALAVGRLGATISAKHLGFRVITHMAGLHDH